MLPKLLLMLVLPLIGLLADENHSLVQPNCQDIFPTVIQILTTQSDSVQHIEKERLYLKAERIFLTQQGTLLYNGQSSILLPALYSDQTGYYLPCRKREDFRLTCSKPECGRSWWFSENWSIYCPLCGSIGN